MKKFPLPLTVVGLAVFFALHAFGGPTIYNTMLRLTVTDESAFPATAASTTGALVYGGDAGVPYVSRGDGGIWFPICTGGGCPLGATGLTTDGGVLSSAPSGSNAFSVATNGGRIDFGAGASDYASSDGTTVTYAGPVAGASALNKGTYTLTVGTATATVTAGAQCVCGLSVGTVWPKCTVASTTLTITGTGSDTGTYICL